MSIERQLWTESPEKMGSLTVPELDPCDILVEGGHLIKETTFERQLWRGGASKVGDGGIRIKGWALGVTKAYDVKKGFFFNDSLIETLHIVILSFNRCQFLKFTFTTPLQKYSYVSTVLFCLHYTSSTHCQLPGNRCHWSQTIHPLISTQTYKFRSINPYKSLLFWGHHWFQTYFTKYNHRYSLFGVILQWADYF